MIENYILELTSSLASNLKEDANLKIVDNTILSQLVRSDPYSVTQEYSNPYNPISYEEHNAVQDKVIDLLSKSLYGQLNFLKNDVVPVIDSVYENVKNALTDYFNYSPMNDIKIVSCYLNEDIDSEDWKDYSKNFSDGYPTPVENIILFDYNPEKLTDDQVSDISQRVLSLMCDENTCGDIYTLVAIVNDLFYPVGGDSYYDKLDNILAKFKVAKVLQTELDSLLPLVNPKYNISQVEGYLADLRKYLSSMAKNLKNSIKQRIEANILVDHLDKTNNVIYVTGPLYEKFLSEGYNNSILYGLLASSSVPITAFLYNNVVENKDKWLEAFNSFVNLKKVSNELHLFNEFSQIVEMYLYNSLSNKSKAEEEYVASNPGYGMTVAQNLKKELSKVVSSDIMDAASLYNTIAKIVCKVRYFYTDMDKLVDYMRAESATVKDNSDLTVLATVFYLTDYFASQLSFN